MSPKGVVVMKNIFACAHKAWTFPRETLRSTLSPTNVAFAQDLCVLAFICKPFAFPEEHEDEWQRLNQHCFSTALTRLSLSLVHPSSCCPYLSLTPHRLRKHLTFHLLFLNRIDMKLGKGFGTLAQIMAMIWTG